MPIRTRYIVLGIAAILVVGGGLLTLNRVKGRAVPEEIRNVLLKQPVTLQSVSLTDHQGKAMTTEWFHNQWTFVFFGFTHCHDICPATLAQMAAIDKQIARDLPASPARRFLFVGVDPQRDSQEQLKSFVTGFGKNFYGATGDPERIGALEQQFSAYHKAKPEKASGDYAVVHSAEMYVVDPAGRVLARILPPVDPAVAARQFVLLTDVLANNDHGVIR